jgi:hypothetical protein
MEFAPGEVKDFGVKWEGGFSWKTGIQEWFTGEVNREA